MRHLFGIPIRGSVATLCGGFRVVARAEVDGKVCVSTLSSADSAMLELASLFFSYQYLSDGA